MRKSFFFTFIGVLLGLAAPFGALVLLWFSPHPAFQIPVFILEEWRNNLFFFTYMLVGTSLVFGFFGFAMGRGLDVIERQNRLLTLQANRDPLTGLYNRRHMLEVLRTEFEKHQASGLPLSCLMMDLDHFKKVNDTCGHPFGDKVLKHFALIIGDCVRDSDTAARYGGEEFLCVLPQCDPATARQVAERIRREMGAHAFYFGGKRLKVTVSLGVATSDGKSPGGYQALVEQVDQLLYQAKRSGRNRVVAAPVSRKRRSGILPTP